MCPGTELWQGNISLPKCGHESYGERPGHTKTKQNNYNNKRASAPADRELAADLGQGLS